MKAGEWQEFAGNNWPVRIINQRLHLHLPLKHQSVAVCTSTDYCISRFANFHIACFHIFLMEEFAKCFTDDKNGYKQKELLALAELITEQPETDEESGHDDNNDTSQEEE